MRNDRLKMLYRACKLIHFRRPLKAAFNRTFSTYRVDDKALPIIAKKAFDAIKAHNIAEARFKDFGLTLHVRAYKMPSAKQLAAFDEIVKAFN